MGRKNQLVGTVVGKNLDTVPANASAAFSNRLHSCERTVRSRGQPRVTQLNLGELDIAGLVVLSTTSRATDVALRSNDRQTMLRACRQHLRPKRLRPFRDNLTVFQYTDWRAVHLCDSPRPPNGGRHCAFHRFKKSLIFRRCGCLLHGPSSISIGLSPELS